MTKKSFVVILILSVTTVYGSSIVDAIFSGTLLGGRSGFPFKDSSTTMFGGGTTNYFLTVLNILFWFLIILGIWKVLPKFFKKS